MKVREIMSSPVVTVSPEATVGEVARTMTDRALSGLPVVDARGLMLGMVTQNDLVVKHAHVHVPRYIGILGGVLPIETGTTDEEMRRVLAVTARDLMTENVVTISPEAEVEDAASLMVERAANPIPVLVRRSLIGIISRTDIIRLLVLEEGDGSAGGTG
jgi:CBS domain-containing protein